MVISKATTVSEYLAELSPERSKALSEVRKTIKANLPAGYKEGMLYGMIAYFIPLKDFPDTYNKQPLTYVSLASQKNYMGLYLNHVYTNPELERWFRESYKASGKNLDMGKACVIFKTLDDLPLELVGQVVAKMPPQDYIAIHLASRAKAKPATKPRKK